MPHPGGLPGGRVSAPLDGEAGRGFTTDSSLDSTQEGTWDWHSLPWEGLHGHRLSPNLLLSKLEKKWKQCKAHIAKMKADTYFRKRANGSHCGGGRHRHTDHWDRIECLEIALMYGVK